MLKSKVTSLVLFCFTLLSFSQENDTDLKIFLDCNRCDNTYIKQNLNNVEFVRDQNFADVHLFFTTQRTGSDGRSYEIEFIGKNEFENLQDTLSFSTDTDMTNDDIRQRILKYIKLGLVRYWVKQGQVDNVSVTVTKPVGDDEKKDEKDPWNYWVFRVGANGFFNGQETSKFSNLNFSVSAKRVTDKNKFSIRIGFNESKSTFSFGDEEIVSIRSSKSVRASDIISLNEHWSVGAFVRLGSSVFSNKDFYWSFRPAIEYNFFKYSESSKKQLTLSYRNGIVFNNYIERSIFGEDQEYLWEHELNLGGSVNQKWGSISGEASYEQFLHDTTLNSLSFFIGTNVRLFKGFSLNLNGSYSITRNQIDLPAGDVSLEELLLQQQQLKSGYNYFVSIGFSYSFGSIYNTIVNPRFNF
ncbi:hypothetical protein JYT34_00435 [Olleya sp. AH-315-K02]|nr:hypothetical protein [Olleya sp. AH-315-K02]